MVAGGRLHARFAGTPVFTGGRTLLSLEEASPGGDEGCLLFPALRRQR